MIGTLSILWRMGAQSRIERYAVPQRIVCQLRSSEDRCWGILRPLHIYSHSDGRAAIQRILKSLVVVESDSESGERDHRPWLHRGDIQTFQFSWAHSRLLFEYRGLGDQSNSSELKVRGDSFDLRRISPVPRKEFLRVFYCIAVDTVTIHRAAIISMDHSATTWTQDKLSQDIEYLFEGFLPGK